MRGRGRDGRGVKRGRSGGPIAQFSSPGSFDSNTTVLGKDFEHRVLNLLMKDHPAGIKLQDLLNRLPCTQSRLEHKKSTNRILYKLQQDGFIDRTPDNPPVWQLLAKGVSRVNSGNSDASVDPNAPLPPPMPISSPPNLPLEPVFSPPLPPPMPKSSNGTSTPSKAASVNYMVKSDSIVQPSVDTSSFNSFDTKVIYLICEKQASGINLVELVDDLHTGGSDRLETKQLTNRSLYKLEKDEFIEKTDENPPVWRLLDRGVAAVNSLLNSTPTTSDCGTISNKQSSCDNSFMEIEDSYQDMQYSAEVDSFQNSQSFSSGSYDHFDVSVLNRMLNRHPSGVKLVDLVRELNTDGPLIETRKATNRSLYKLQADSMVRRSEENPPVWSMLEKGVNTVNNLNANPQNIAPCQPPPMESPHPAHNQPSAPVFSAPSPHIHTRPLPNIDPGTHTWVFEVIANNHPRQLKSLEVKAQLNHAGHVGLTKKEINWALYSLMEKQLIQRSSENPPVWKLLTRGEQLFQQMKSVPPTSYQSPARGYTHTSMMSTPTMSPSLSTSGYSPELAATNIPGLATLPVLMTASKTSPNLTAVSVLNEYCQTGKLKIVYDHTHSGPDHKRKFATVLTIGRVTFPPVISHSKKESKLLAAKKAVEALLSRHPGRRVSMPGILTTSPTPAAASVVVSKSLPPSPTGGAAGKDKPAAEGKNPISILHEYCQTNKLMIESEFSEEGSDPASRKFFCSFIIGDERFPTFHASSKKDAKNLAAKMVVDDLYKSGRLSKTPLTNNIVNQVNVVLQPTEQDEIARLVTSKFEQLMTQLPDAIMGRKIYAGFVMSREVEEGRMEEGDEEEVQAKRMRMEPKKYWTVVSIGSGNRCVTGDMLSMQGETVNDCHAEVIARRGLVRFLYRQLVQYLNNTSGAEIIFMEDAQKKIRVKPTIQFHLYISTAPCGDSALFAHSDMNQASAVNGPDGGTVHKPTMENKKQGQLRTKVENGEGCIPISDDDNVPTWDGLLRGERLRTMSCSDKVMKWNFLGLQGALLSAMIEPVYMSSLTLGTLYHHGHLSRAICCRTEKYIEKLRESVPPSYKVNHPKIGRVSGQEPIRHATKTKTREYSLNWTLGDGKAEVLDGTKGRCEVKFGSPNPISQVGKCNLYKLFKQLATMYPAKLRVETSYTRTKQQATDYQLAKQIMKKSYETAGCGKWMDKPCEADDFA